MLSKLAANLFLATKISFANELAALCDLHGSRVERGGVLVAVESDDVSSERLRSELAQLGGRTYGADQTTARPESRPTM